MAEQAFTLAPDAVAASTLADLFVTWDRTKIYNKLLDLLRVRNFPTTDWNEGGVERTLVEMEADALADMIAGAVPTIAGSALVDFATGDWLRLLAKQWYGIDYNPATRTVGAVTFACALGAGPQTFGAFDITVEAASGNGYTNTVGFTVPDGGSISVPVQSEFANDSTIGRNYIDGNGTITKLRTVKPGISVSNAQPDFSPVALVGYSTGTITPSRTNPLLAPTACRISVVVKTAGSLGGVVVDIYVDDVLTQANQTIAVGPNNYRDIAGKNIRLTFDNGFALPSFLLGDTFSLQSPGSWITSQGTNIESDEALRARCKARWPALSDSPTANVFELHARNASSQVTRVTATASEVVPGQVDIVIAGQAGPVSVGLVADVKSYVQARTPLTTRANVLSAIEEPISLLGLVYVENAKIEAAQTAATAAVLAYINSVPIGGVVRYFDIIAVIMSVDGVIDVEGITVNGDTLNRFLTGPYVATFAEDLASVLEWVQQ